MKRFLLLSCLALCAPVGAQDAPARPAAPLADAATPALQSDAAVILTPDFIRSCTFIAQGTLNLKEVDGQTLGELPPGQHERFKGPSEFVTLRLGLGDPQSWKSGEKALVLARFSSLQRRAVILARLPATPENISRVQRKPWARP